MSDIKKECIESDGYRLGRAPGDRKGSLLKTTESVDGIIPSPDYPILQCIMTVWWQNSIAWRTQ